jgi:zinc-ribbon domain
MAGTETRYCPNCGERISVRSRFCPSCGARQEDYVVAKVAAPAEPPRAEPEPAPAAPPPPPRAEPLRERIGRVDPQAGELSELLVGRLALPGVVAAGLAALAAAAAVLVAGLIIALATPDASILGIVGRDGGIVTEALRQAVGTLLAPVIDTGALSGASGRLAPMVFAAIPIGAVAFATRWQLHRTEGAAPPARVAWAALAGLPFGLLMLAAAVLGGDSDATNVSPSAGAAFGLGLLWGVVGAVIGAATALPLDVGGLPARARRLLDAVGATLRPLAALLVVCAAVGLVGWVVQVGADVDSIRAGRSTATALVEESLYAGEHGVHLAALGAGARFTADGRGALGLPFPVDQAADVPGGDGGLRIFSYSDAMPAYVLLPAIVALMALLIFGALYAGFAAARAVGAATVPMGAAWGAVTGPAWAIAMTILSALAGGLFHGDADGGSVFGLFLVLGALLGAGGGALAVSGAAAPAESQARAPAGDAA